MSTNEQHANKEEENQKPDVPRIRMKGLSRPVSPERVEQVKQNIVVSGQGDLDTPVASGLTDKVNRKSPWRFLGWAAGGLGGLLFAGVAYLFIAGSMAGTEPVPAAPDQAPAASVAVSPVVDGSAQGVPPESAVSPSGGPSEGVSGTAVVSAPVSSPAPASATSGDELVPSTSVPAPVVAPTAAPSSAVYNNRLLKLSLEYPASLYVEEKQDKAMEILRDSGISGGSDLFRGDLHATLPLVEFSLKDKSNTNIVLAIVPTGSEKVNSVFSFLVDGDFTVSGSTKQQAGPKNDRFDILTYTLKNDYLTMYGSQTHLMQGGNMLVAAVISESKSDMVAQSSQLKKILQSVKITK